MEAGSLYLLTLLIVPGLIGVMLLMEWLETHVAHRMIADEIAMLLRAEGPIEDLESRIARASEPLVVAMRGVRGAAAMDHQHAQRTA